MEREHVLTLRRSDAPTLSRSHVLTADLCPCRDLFLAPVLAAGPEGVAEPRAQAGAAHGVEQLPAAVVLGAHCVGSLAPNQSAVPEVSREGQLVQVAVAEPQALSLAETRAVAERSALSLALTSASLGE